MTRKQLRDENGQYAGSIGDGKTPPPSDSFRPPTPDLSGSDPVVLVNDVWRVYEKTVTETLLENEVDRLASLRDSGPVAADIVALVRQHDAEQAIQVFNGEATPQGEDAQSLWDGLSEPMREQLRDITLAEAEARVRAGIARARAAVPQDCCPDCGHTVTDTQIAYCECDCHNDRSDAAPQDEPFSCKCGHGYDSHDTPGTRESPDHCLRPECSCGFFVAAANGTSPSLPIYEIVAERPSGQSFVRDDAHILADVLLVSRLANQSDLHQNIQDLRTQGRRITLYLSDEEMTDYINALNARIETYPEAREDRTSEQQILWLYHHSMKMSAIAEMLEREQDFYQAGGMLDDF